MDCAVETYLSLSAIILGTAMVSMFLGFMVAAMLAAGARADERDEMDRIL